MHEIVTLQFGQAANYLGTHYWNTQESYFTYAGQDESPVDHDVSFRAGIGADGSDTYTPRTLIYDLKGAFGTLRRESALYELQQQEQPNRNGPWSGSTMSLQLPPIGQSLYQQALDHGLEPPQLNNELVRFWSDYNHLFYHPRSIVQLNEYELNSSLMPFEKWQTGEELFANLDREHDLLDRDLRPLLEECDQLQALQIFAATDDAWGGFTAKYLERISDELGKGCRWVFGLQDGTQQARQRQQLQVANFAQSVYAFDSTASLHIPVTSNPSHLPGYVALDRSSSWQTSALRAAAVETICLPARLRSSETGCTTFAAMETTLNNDGHRRIAASVLSVEDSAALRERLEKDSAGDTRMINGLADDHDDDEILLDIDLLPGTRHLTGNSGARLGRRAHIFSRCESLRGPWRSYADIENSNANSRERFSHGPRTSTHQSQLLFPILPSFPRIFRFPGHSDRLAVKTTVSTSTAVADRLRDLEITARNLISLDDREALCDGLVSIAEEYEEGWSGSDGSDDDD